MFPQETNQAVKLQVDARCAKRHGKQDTSLNWIFSILCLLQAPPSIYIIFKSTDFRRCLVGVAVQRIG